MKRYVLSPVTNVTLEEVGDIQAWVKEKEKGGDTVHLPWRDIDQKGLSGTGCCLQNLKAMQECDVVDIYWNPERSPGSIFDLGMAFALGKRIHTINRVVYDSKHTLEQLIVEGWEQAREKTREIDE